MAELCYAMFTFLQTNKVFSSLKFTFAGVRKEIIMANESYYTASHLHIPTLGV